MRLLATLCIGLLPLGVLSAANASVSNPILHETFSFRLGGAYLGGDTNVGSELKGGGIVEDIGFNDVGVDGDELSPYFSAKWRFTDSFSTSFEYFGWQDDGKGTANRDLVFGDITIPAGFSASAEIDVNIYAISLDYSVAQSDDYEAGIGLGVHVADMKASLAGQGFIGSGNSSSVRETADVTAPLPNISLHGTYAFSPKWAIGANLGYFSLSYDKYDGSLLVASATVEYRFSENFGAGLGYSYFDVDLEIDNTRTTDSYELTLDGPVLFLSAGF